MHTQFQYLNWMCEITDSAFMEDLCHHKSKSGRINGQISIWILGTFCNVCSEVWTMVQLSQAYLHRQLDMRDSWIDSYIENDIEEWIALGPS